MSHHVAYICEDGHVNSAISQPMGNGLCILCEKKVISKCPECSEPIPGAKTPSSNTYTPPRECLKCKKPFPWAKKSLHFFDIISDAH